MTAAVATPAGVVVRSIGSDGSRAAPRLVPLPTTTLPPRSTTTAPRSTSTSAAATPPTTGAPATTTTVTATTAPTTPPTVPPTSPTSPAPTSVAPTSTVVTPATVASTTATTQPVPEPPTSPSTSPPSTAPVAEPFVYSFPVVVDPEDPALQPPVIVGASTWCQGNFDEGQIGIAVQNVDAYHYPPPFVATYAWTLTDAAADVTSSGTFELAGWETHAVHLSTTLVGPRTFTVTDVALGTSASVDLDLPDCVNAPPPVVADPLGPAVVIASVVCSEDINATSGTGSFHVHIQNPPGDDGTDRQYDVDVLAAQVSVWTDTTEPLFDGSWADEDAAFFHSGSYMVMVNDHDSPALAVAVAVDVPECAPAPPPPADPSPPNAPLIIDVSTTCADPVLEDGRADFVRLNPNWQFLGGPGELTYDWSVVTGTTVVQSFQGWFNASGVYVSFLQPLAPGEYTASINAAGFPALGNSVTFTIDDCTLQPQPDPVPLAIYGVTTLCLPGDATESAVWVVEQHGTVQPAWFEWTIRDDAMLSVDTDSPVTILDDQPTPLSSRALPLGTMHLTVTGVADPAVTASATFDIGPCTDPVDPVDPSTTRPTRRNPPTPPRRAAPTSPLEPTEPSEPAGTTSLPPAVPDTTPPTGLLPATR